MRVTVEIGVDGLADVLEVVLDGDEADEALPGLVMALVFAPVVVAAFEHTVGIMFPHLGTRRCSRLQSLTFCKSAFKVPIAKIYQQMMSDQPSCG